MAIATIRPPASRAMARIEARASGDGSPGSTTRSSRRPRTRVSTTWPGTPPAVHDVDRMTPSARRSTEEGRVAPIASPATASKSGRSTIRWRVAIVGIHISISRPAIASRAARAVVQRWSATSSPTNVASRRSAAPPRRSGHRTGGDRRPGSPIGRSARAGRDAGAGRAARRCRRRCVDRLRRSARSSARSAASRRARLDVSARSTPASSNSSRTAATWSAAASPGSTPPPSRRPPARRSATTCADETRVAVRCIHPSAREHHHPGGERHRRRPPGEEHLDARRGRAGARMTVAAGRGVTGSPATGAGRRPIRVRRRRPGPRRRPRRSRA